jgi:hypothetical protein
MTEWNGIISMVVCASLVLILVGFNRYEMCNSSLVSCSC